MKTAFAVASALCGLVWTQTSGYAQPSSASPTKTNVAEPAASGSLASLAEKIKAANANSHPRVSEVVKMSDAGVDEKTILSYVENSPGFRLNADDVIYLHEKGISATIITALLQHPPKVQVAQAAVTPNQNPPAQEAPPATTYAQPAQPVYVAPQVVYTQPSYVYSYPSYSYVGVPYYYSRPYFSFGFHGGCLPIHRFGGYHHFYRSGFRCR